MYKVIIMHDEVLERFDLPQQIRMARCVEFTSEIIDDGAYSEIGQSGPDVVVMSVKALGAGLKEIMTFSSDIQYLIVYDSFESDLGGHFNPMSRQCSFFDAQAAEDIVAVVNGVLNRLKSVRAKENFEKMVIRESERLKPIIKEQFFKEFILGVGNTQEIFDIYCETFNVSPNQNVHMLLFRPEQEIGFEDSFFLKNIIEGHIGTDNIVMSTVMKDHILVVTKIENSNRISGILGKLERVFEKYYTYKITTIYSGLHKISEAPDVYNRLNKSLDYCFYDCGGYAVMAEELDEDAGVVSIEPNYGAIERAVKSADDEKMQVLLHGFFRDIERAKAEPAVARTYCLELFVCIIRCCEVEKIDKYMKGIMELQELKTLSAVKDYIFKLAEEIIGANSPRHMKVYSSLISNTMDIIEKNIGNENLSLRWIANNILYTNVDYLGKLFKKEIGENFSHYVMEKRMEMAKRLIVEGKKDRIYEVAEKVGYGSNSQYFSQVFKKYTGVSPLEYKEYARNSGAV